jgi:hypothetical protein
MRAWFWMGVLVVLAAAIGVACGGGGDGNGDGEAEPTPDRPTLEAWLTEIQLKTETCLHGFGDPHPGFTESRRPKTTGRAPPKVLSVWRASAAGTRPSFLVTDPTGTFTRGGTALVVSSISIFADEEGAKQAMQWGRDLLANPADAATLIPNVSELEGGPISFASVGDETVAAEFTGKTQPEGVPVKIEFTADIVVVRNGKAVVYIAVGAIGGAKPGPEVDELIGILNDRLETVLR